MHTPPLRAPNAPSPGRQATLTPTQPLDTGTAQAGGTAGRAPHKAPRSPPAAAKSRLTLVERQAAATAARGGTTTSPRESKQAAGKAGTKAEVAAARAELVALYTQHNQASARRPPDNHGRGDSVEFL